eukprot:11205774-Lingulodinium_polyedra.AAC.1
MERRLSIPPTGHMIFEKGEFTPGLGLLSALHIGAIANTLADGYAVMHSGFNLCQLWHLPG